MEKVERLADLLLDSAWTRSELERIVVATSRANSIARNNLADRLTGRFPSPPSRSTLIAFLKRMKGLAPSMRLKLLNQLQAATRFEATAMRASIPAANLWEIPPLANVGELAEFLNLPSKFIDWLASHRHSHYRVKLIRKRSTGMRLLEAPKTRLKMVQHRIATEILNSVPAHPAAHGFVRKRSAVSYAQPHVNQPVVLRMDLMDFFPTISASRVFGLFRSLGYPYAVTHLLCNLCTAVTSIDMLEDATRALGEQAIGYSVQQHATRERLRSLYCERHLPQGAPTSPALANLIAYRLDCRLSGLAASTNVTYTRYADDLLFSGNDDFGRTVKSFAVQVGAIALDEGFDVNFRKTRIMRRSTRQFAAGIVINQRTNIQRVAYDQLKATLHNCLTRGPAAQNREARSDFRMHLLGKINWVKQLNPNRGAKLAKIFGEIDWDQSHNSASNLKSKNG
jgi:retron-type reverse transcriptase